MLEVAITYVCLVVAILVLWIIHEVVFEASGEVLLEAVVNLLDFFLSSLVDVDQDREL